VRPADAAASPLKSLPAMDPTIAMSCEPADGLWGMGTGRRQCDEQKVDA
jgi:hypothetical protein